jgi:peroxiredoxin
MATHSTTASVGTTAPDFALPDASGTTVGLGDALRRGPVVLVFLRGYA